MDQSARLKLMLLVVLLMVLGACGQRDAAQDVVIPTLMVLPTETPTSTPSRTPIPTWTDTPTLTVTPSATPTDTPVPTYTPSHTPTPTQTFTPSNTPTFTLTPTPSATPTATVTSSPTSTFTITPSLTPSRTPTPIPTLTPSLTPTPNAPQILSFSASANNVAANTTITLSWFTESDSARIDQLNAQGQVIQSFPVVTSGQFSLAVPGSTGKLVIYRLTAIRNFQQVSQSIPITVQCSISWFFGDQFAPQDAGCPQALGAIAPGAYQTFERGVMIYVTANGLNRIYGLQNDGNRYIAYANGWDGVTLRSDPAPAGLFMPGQMFNWAYYNTLAPIGTWGRQLGWATSSIDTGDRTIQFEVGASGTLPFYIDAGGAVYRLSGGDSGTWTRIK
jgi:hypothetical protein